MPPDSSKTVEGVWYSERSRIVEMIADLLGGAGRTKAVPRATR
jgi:hypothetical protein